jgi:hypothetical protein
MKKYIPLIVACCVVIPSAVLLGLLAGAAFGRSAGVVGILVILLVAAYSRRLNAEKKLGR